MKQATNSGATTGVSAWFFCGGQLWAKLAGVHTTRIAWQAWGRRASFGSHATPLYVTNGRQRHRSTTSFFPHRKSPPHNLPMRTCY